MYKARKSKGHTFLGRVPELGYVILRDNDTKKVELWTESRGLSLNVTRIQGFEFEFVREIKCAYRVPDTRFNQEHYPDDIGRIYVDHRPRLAEVQEVK